MTTWSVTVMASLDPYVTQQVEASGLHEALEKASSIPLADWLDPEPDEHEA